MEPYFESVIRGCFVRIGIGANTLGQSVYRVCEVVGVDARDTAKQVGASPWGFVAVRANGRADSHVETGAHCVMQLVISQHMSR